MVNLRIGIVGGTGSMGRGLALRWALMHDIWLGSREVEKANAVAREYDSIARGFHEDRMKGSIAGALNPEVPRLVDVVVLTLPSRHAIEVVRQIKGNLTPAHVIVSVIVPMIKKGRLFTHSPVIEDGKAIADKSAAELVAEEVSSTPVVSAFQTVPAGYLGDLDSVLNVDVLLSGDDERALDLVSKIAQDIPNLRALRVGPLSNSRFVESITPLLLNAAILNNLKDPSIRIVPWFPSDFTKE
jgi:NADPH-dependent F420 reductase